MLSANERISNERNSLSRNQLQNIRDEFFIRLDVRILFRLRFLKVEYIIHRFLYRIMTNSDIFLYVHE